MAHFMKTFRKNRKALLAALTLMAMFSFVFLPTIMEMMSIGRGRGNPVVVKTAKYGSLNERQLALMMQQRQRLYQFFLQLQGAVRAKGGRADAVSQALYMFQGSPANEEAAVEDWLHARKAEELGVNVSEKAINDHLASLTEGKVGGDDVRQILQKLRMGQPQLFEALRQAMMSRQLVQMFGISLEANTPEQRWEYYQQVNRRAKIEAVPIAVSTLVDKVPAPSDDVLQAFFDKYKDRPSDPNSPEPGLREPHRIDVQYLKATYESFMDPAAVTEQAIRDYYEANKERLYKDMLPEAPPPAAPKTEAPKAETPKTESGKASATGKEAPKAEPAKKEAAKSPAAQEPPKTNPAKMEPPKSEPPKTAAPKAEPPKAGIEKGKTAPSVPGKSSSLPRRSPFRLVSEQKTVTPPSEAKKVEPAAKAEPAPVKASPVAPKAESQSLLPAVAGVPGVAPVKYKPLADVKDEIRKSLAREAAQAKVREVLRRVQDKLAQFATQWTIYDTLDPEKKVSATPPTRPDFVALAKENRLTAAETGLKSALQIRGTDIGRSRAEGGAPFTDAAYQKNSPVFLPGTTQDDEGASYLYWKVNESPEQVPSFDAAGVRQHVLDTWKFIQARDLATKEAERLAAEARTAAKPLAAVFAGRKDLQVLTPAPFTWLTFGNVPAWFRMRPPQFSEVTGIQGAGSEFMRAVFALKAGEIGVAADQPKSTVYVIRLAEYTPSDSVLWDMFVTDDYRGYAMAASYDQRVASQLWREGIRSEAGLRWEREPNRGRGDEIDD